MKKFFLLIFILLFLISCSNTSDNAVVEKSNLGEPTIHYYYESGIKELNAGHFQKAISDFSIVIEKSPEYVDAYIYRAFIYFKLKRFKKALKDETIAIQLAPDYHLPYCNRARTHRNLKLLQKGLMDGNKCLKLDPNYGHGYYLRGLIYSNLKNMKAARKDWKTGCEIGLLYSCQALQNSN